MRREPTAKKWLDANTAWRLKSLDQIERWVEEDGPLSERERAIVRRQAIKRFTRLESFIWSFFPDAPPAPIEPHSAAALIVLPRQQALRLARRLFGGGPGIAGDLEADDLSFNMDWFRPRGLQ